MFPVNALSTVLKLLGTSWIVVTLVAMSPVGAGELDPAQKKLLQSALSYVKKAQSNLAAAQRGIPRNKPVSKSKAKLALMRSGSAKSDVQTAANALKQLPAGEPEVAAALKHVAEVQRAIAAFEKSLGGSSAPPPTSDGKKLDYRDEKKVKDARYYLNEVGGLANALEKLAKQTGAVKDKDTIDHRIVAQGIATLNKGRQRCGLINGYLQELPADGRGVKSTAQGLAQLTARLNAAEKTLQPLHARLQRIINPATYPNFDADVKRVRELSRMFSDTNVFQSQPEKAVQIVEAAPAARQELVRVVKTYNLLIRQNTDLGKRIGGVANALNRNCTSFAKATAEQKKTLPGRIQKDLDEVAKMATKAIANKTPGWFGGGIPQRMGWAETKMKLLAALDPAGAKPVQAKLTQAAAVLAKQQESLRDQIIANNPLPPDKFAGKDRKAVIERAKAVWKKEQPKAEILGVRIPSEGWERETMWRLQNTTWYRIDRSKLQVQLLVRHDDKTAVVRAVNMWIDHQKGGKLTQFPFSKVGDKLPPTFFVLTSKIR